MKRGEEKPPSNEVVERGRSDRRRASWAARLVATVIAERWRTVFTSRAGPAVGRKPARHVINVERKYCVCVCVCVHLMHVGIVQLKAHSLSQPPEIPRAGGGRGVDACLRPEGLRIRAWVH